MIKEQGPKTKYMPSRDRMPISRSIKTVSSQWRKLIVIYLVYSSQVGTQFISSSVFPWRAASIVNPQYEDTLRKLVKTTLHHINPGEHPSPSGPPINNSESSKRLSRFRTFFKSSKNIETREPIKPTNIDAANSVSVMLATAQRIDLDANIRASVRWARLLLLPENANENAVLVERVSQSQTCTIFNPLMPCCRVLEGSCIRSQFYGEGPPPMSWGHPQWHCRHLEFSSTHHGTSPWT